MVFIVYSFINFVYNQILKNLTYGKNMFLNYALTLFIFLLICNIFLEWFHTH
jgi:F0F1-type ATP synthase membrane subunit a